jgi:beta-galactosidase
MRARGADSVVMWHWRNHLANAENDSDTVCDNAGRPDPKRVELLRQIASRPELQAPPPPKLPRRRAAFLYDIDAVRPHLTLDPYMKRGLDHRVGYLRVFIETYKPLWELGVGVDVLRPGMSLDGYDLLVAPSPRLLSREHAKQIHDFVARGGTLLLVAKAAHQDPWGAYYNTPGEPLAEVIGGQVYRNHNLPDDTRITVRMDDESFHCLAHADRIEPTTAQVLATFETGPFSGAPAAMMNRVGKGVCYYAAGCSPRLIERLAIRAARDAGLPMVEAPVDNVAVLIESDGTWVFNHTATPQLVEGVQVPARDFAFVRQA